MNDRNNLLLLNTILEKTPLTVVPRVVKTIPRLAKYINKVAAKYDPKHMMEAIYITLNGPPPQCEYGNKKQFNTFNLGYRQGCIKGNKCPCVGKIRMEAQKATLIERYGVDAVSRIPGIEEKRKQTCRNLYGVDHHTQTEKYRDHVAKNPRDAEKVKQAQKKSSDTMMKRFGTSHHMKLKTQQELVKQTMMEGHGVCFPAQSAQIQEKIQETWKSIDKSAVQKKRNKSNLEKFGVEHPAQIQLSEEARRVLLSEKTFLAYVQGKTRNEVVAALEISPHCLYLYSKKYSAENLFKKPPASQFEIEVASFLDEHGISYTQNSRTIISPLELDFFLPEFNVAIECCGLYWHAEESAGRKQYYHKKKHDKCLKRGITLLTIFEDEWHTNNAQITSRILRLIGHSAVQSIPHEQCKFRKSGNIYELIYDNGVVLAVETETETDMMIITEIYEKEKTQVVGGIKFLLSKIQSGVIEYISDDRFGEHKILTEQTNFKKTFTTTSFWYTDYKFRTNTPNRDRIWDCGRTTWQLINKT